MEIMKAFSSIPCPCGKPHDFDAQVIIGDGVIRQLPDILHTYRAKKLFLIADKNTYPAAGKAVEEILTSAGFSVSLCLFREESVIPDEHSVGFAAMKFTPDCDVVVSVGSGVLNDIGKIISNISGKPYIIVGTAPSMDGYASASSSMELQGLKVTLNSKCPDVILGDLDILCAAPTKMMVSGLGDMLAKYVSICEWRISHLINGEYYCERIADLVRTALKKCVDNSDGLLKRDREAVRAVFEGLIIGGAAMKYAGISRPASGVEHYISHVWDMRGAEFGLPTEFHGLQCAVGTLIAVGVYEKLLAMTPDREKALRYAEAFDFAAWSDTLRQFLGTGAESMIALEAKEQKYNVEKHHARLEVILQNWDEIKRIAAEELPSSAELLALMDRLGAPKTPADLGVDPAILPMTFKATKDIRDKYVLSRLCWDLGVLEEII